MLAAALAPGTAAATPGSHRHPFIKAAVARPQAPPPVRLTPVNGPLPAEAESTPFAPADQVALRPLVVALDGTDFGLPTWRAVLNRIGTPYDVLLAKDEPLTAQRLVRSDGVGRYNAVLLTDNALLYRNSSGGYVSAFDDTEWRTLWAYERSHRVRQVSLFTSWGTFPEDHCLRPGVEGEVNPPVQAALTTAGAALFDHLEANALVPISDSYAYRSVLAPNCAAQPLLTVGTHVLGVTSTSTDGRERAALTFSSNENLAQTDMLAPGLLRWATRGVHLGEQRHWLNADVDDWFNSSDHLYPDGRLETDPGFRLSGTEAAAVAVQQRTLRAEHPVAAGFTLNLPYNGGDLNTAAPSRCSSLLTPDPLTSYSRCLSREFRWVNHTVSHPELNATDYATSRGEIADNLTIGRNAGLTVPTDVLKTPAYSGLGVYNPDPNAPDTDPPTDFGLARSNQAMLDAARDVGVRYLHGNMSFASHRPACFNCGTYHPLRPELLVVPDWPTNIGYQTTAPAELTLFYNRLYGPNGRFPYHDHDLTYAEVVHYESEVALQHVMTGSVYSHTLHQGNLRQYGVGRSLTFDWLKAVVDKYDARYRVPLKNPDWPTLARYVQARNAHFAELAAGGDAIWDRAANTVTYTAATAGSLFITGATASGAETERYGQDSVTRITTRAGTRVTAAVDTRR